METMVIDTETAEVELFPTREQAEQFIRDNNLSKDVCIIMPCIEVNDKEDVELVIYENSDNNIFGSVADYQSYARQRCYAYGWSENDYLALVTLWNRESGWNPSAKNRSSGAYGIPQALPGSKMASSGSDWATNYQTQINWGLNYIKGRYGNPSSALAHSNSRGWY